MIVPLVIFAIAVPATTALTLGQYDSIWQRPSWSSPMTRRNPLLINDFFAAFFIAIGLGMLLVIFHDPSHWWLPAFAFSAGFGELIGLKITEKVFASRIAPSRD